MRLAGTEPLSLFLSKLLQRKSKVIDHLIFYLTMEFGVTIPIEGTYRTFRFGILDRNSGIDPVKLLFDKSLS